MDNDEERPTLSRRASSIFSIDTTPLAPPNKTDIEMFTSDAYHFSMIRNLHLADYITMLNGFCGFYSIVSCLRFTLTGKPHYVQRAHFFIFLGMCFDFFDGRVARLRNRSSLWARSQTLQPTWSPLAWLLQLQRLPSASRPPWMCSCCLSSCFARQQDWPDSTSPWVNYPRTSRASLSSLRACQCLLLCCWCWVWPVW